MPDEKKGITVKIDAALHAQVREYVESHNMTMAEFVSQALDNELHPKFQMKEMQTMANTRTIARKIIVLEFILAFIVQYPPCYDLPLLNSTLMKSQEVRA